MIDLQDYMANRSSAPRRLIMSKVVAKHPAFCFTLMIGKTKVHIAPKMWRDQNGNWTMSKRYIEAIKRQQMQASPPSDTPEDSPAS